MVADGLYCELVASESVVSVGGFWTMTEVLLFSTCTRSLRDVERDGRCGLDGWFDCSLGTKRTKGFPL